MRVAVFRPDDERLERAVAAIEDRGWEPLGDALLAVEPTGRTPRTEADVVVFTSVTGVELALDGLDAGALDGAVVAAIGPKTAEALRDGGRRTASDGPSERGRSDDGVAVDVVPDAYTSAGLVTALGDDVAGLDVEVARSDHGDPALLEGLEEAGASVHETVLYRLTRPPDGGNATVEALHDGELDAALFTSSLTVEHLLEAAGDDREAIVAALDGVLVGAIGEPTAATARDHGVAVDVVPEEETFSALLEAVDRAA